MLIELILNIFENLLRRNDQSYVRSNSAFFSNMTPIWYLRSIKVLVTAWSDAAVKLHNMKLLSGDEEEINNNTIITDCVRNCTRILSEMHKEETMLNNMQKKNNNGNIHDKNCLSNGMFFMVNILIRLCDVINNQTFLKESMSSIEKYNDSLFPKSDVVTSSFYYGRLMARHDRLPDARLSLQKAFRMSRNGASGKKSYYNKVRILILLAPINMAFGESPKPQLLAVKSWLCLD